MGSEPIYRPGIRGWWAFAYRYSPRGAIKREFVTDFLRRARPSARLRQAETERAFYQREFYEAPTLAEVKQLRALLHRIRGMYATPPVVVSVIDESGLLGPSDG
jgi:hypothetical protein